YTILWWRDASADLQSQNEEGDRDQCARHRADRSNGRILQIEGTPVPAGVWSAGGGNAWDPGRSDDDARGIRHDVVEGRSRGGDSDGGSRRYTRSTNGSIKERSRWSTCEACRRRAVSSRWLTSRTGRFTSRSHPKPHIRESRSTSFSRGRRGPRCCKRSTFSRMLM